MSGADAVAAGGVLGWIKGHVPTREAIERNRLLRPVAGRILRPSLWHFNRRSVPRAAAVGAASSSGAALQGSQDRVATSVMGLASHP